MKDALITPFNVGMLPADLTQWFGLPEDHPYVGRVDILPIQFYLIRLPGRNILVDAPSYEFPGDDSMLIAEYKGRTAAKLLSEAGIPPEAISEIILTHPHLDHTLGLALPVNEPNTPVFPNARHYLSAKDWYNLPNMEEVEQAPLKAIEKAGLLTLVEGPLELGNGLTLLPAPGETPGHQIVRLKHAEGETYIVGDLFHHALEFEETARCPIWADAETMTASKTMLMQWAAESSADVLFTHIEGAYHVEGNGSNLKWVKSELRR